MRMSPNDRLLQTVSASSDVYIEETFSILACGGTVVIGAETPLDATEFLRQIDAEGITVAGLPTAALHALIGSWPAGERIPPRSMLRRIIVGGQQLSASAAQKWRKRRVVDRRR